MNRDKRRRRFCAFWQIKIAQKLDAVVIGVSDTAVERNAAIRHCVTSCLEPHAMAKWICRGRTTAQD
jgi:hypothetical protein